MKRILAALLLTLFLAVGTFAKTISEPKGFTKKLYDASYALYATSADRGFTTPRFICTVTNIEKFQEGYLFLGAGHCTSVNPELSDDMQFFVATDLDHIPQPVELLTARMKENFKPTEVAGNQLDYALFYLKTKAKLPTIDLGDEGSLRIGDKTINVNYSLGLTKYVAPGIVSSKVALKGESAGFFGVQMFMSHGASGSSVVDVKTHKIVGLVIAGEDGATVPAWIEPISTIRAALATTDLAYLIAHPDVPKVDHSIIIEYNDDMVSLLSFGGSHSNHGNSGTGSRGGNAPNRVTPPPSRIAPPPNRIEPPANRGREHDREHDRDRDRDHADRHPRGRDIDRDTREHYFGRSHCFKPEVYYNGGFYSFTYAGIWFEYENQWPYPYDDVFIDIDPVTGVYFMSSPAHPGIFVEVWIP